MPFPGLPVLVVDPDPTNAKLVVVILRAEGADARSASSAESALELVPYLEPRLVITELVLPGMDGLALARQLRATEPSIVIVVVTSLNGEESAHKAREAGADEYVQKPLDPAAFVALLDRLVTQGGNR